jgi:2-desacetyl-2-hydroxyethyl bacteriochlorophyllide A dehydrogenase
MKAQALVCDAGQRFSLSGVNLPDPGPDHIVVDTLYSGVSIGTEFALVQGKISWGPYPICTGYQGVGVVLETGRDVVGFSPGDRVYYRDNREMSLSDGTPLSSASGVHCSKALIHVPSTHGVALLPEGVDEEAASLFVMPAVGLNGVDQANPRLGESVVVYGCGLVGLGVVAACSHRGCVVTAIDLRDDPLAVARTLGADHTANVSSPDFHDTVRQIVPDGADVVFESTGIPACIDPAIELCRKRGHFVLQGNYGQEPISYHFLPPHGKQLTWHYPCDDGLAPSRTAVLKNMASDALPWRHVITHRVTSAEAPEFYADINAGDLPDVIGAVVRWQ